MICFCFFFSIFIASNSVCNWKVAKKGPVHYEGEKICVEQHLLQGEPLTCRREVPCCTLKHAVHVFQCFPCHYIRGCPPPPLLEGQVNFIFIYCARSQQKSFKVTFPIEQVYNFSFIKQTKQPYVIYLISYISLSFKALTSRTNRTERLSAQHDWSAVLLIVHERAQITLYSVRVHQRSREVWEDLREPFLSRSSW